jgi:hypothetical protein
LVELAMTTASIAGSASTDSFCRAIVARQPLGRGAIYIDDRAETRPGMARDILRVDSTDAACAKLANADHGRVFGYCPKPTISH